MKGARAYLDPLAAGVRNRRQGDAVSVHGPRETSVYWLRYV
jgi:hypothetical protein